MINKQQFRVCIRRDIGREVKPEAEQIDGNVYWFEHGWVMYEDDLYPGEIAWIADDETYPKDAPIWIASGDLVKEVNNIVNAPSISDMPDLSNIPGISDVPDIK
jgi:hypothetical protein